MSSYMEPGSFRPKIPFHMVWLATNQCNARCAHCSSNSARRYPDELTTEEACDLMGQFANAGVVDLAVSGGEPLLRPDLLYILEYAINVGLSVGVGSNGGKLSQKKAQGLVATGISRFQVSLDGFAEQHDTLRRWPGLFERVLCTIKTAMDAGLRVHVCCTITQLNWRILEPFTEFIFGLGVNRINYSRYVPTGRGTDTLDLTKEQWHSVIYLCNQLKEKYKGRIEIVSHLAQQILVDDEVKEMPGFIGCQAGIGQGAVSSVGEVFPCVLLPIPLGSIRRKRFCDIWSESPIIHALRDRDRLCGHCSKCQLRNRCGGCRAVAFAKSGNFLESDPRCWLIPHDTSGNHFLSLTDEVACHVY